MGVQNEIWVRGITEALYADNTFLSAMTNDDDYVQGGKVVHKPQAGPASSVERNRASLPAAVRVRTDTDLFYELDEFTTDPLRLSNRDEVELSYDKMASFLRQDSGGLLDTVSDWLLYNAAREALASTIIPATGSAAAATATGATGTRNQVAKEDLLTAQTILDKQNVSRNDRHFVCDPDQLAGLLRDQELYNAYERTANRAEGTLPKLFSFNIHLRSKALRLATNDTVKAPNAAGATTDNAGALFFHRVGLCKALGEIRVYERLNDPQYYGPIISMLVRAQAKYNRGDKKGFGIIANVAP